MFIIIYSHGQHVMFRDDTTDLIENHEYPATTEELIEAYGGRTLDLPNGTESLEEILDRPATETFESAQEARETVYASVSQKAIGRVGYSDRDPTPLGAPYAPEQLSF